jgi:hypothetical protein
MEIRTKIRIRTAMEIKRVNVQRTAVHLPKRHQLSN